ncbi:hypothetical protein QAD02_001365 [Eretmocerus hayati]|uniref:Uncharacterized protein n=1 Tax=Eretmocerus hayati TaxID=131215 RepID=A0ACC2NHK9_9HYME|nr:hypothetical protein QAD02_001365 [Eretmocerus hayati]
MRRSKKKSLNGVDTISLERCPSCCPSENIAVRSLSLAEGTLSPEPLSQIESLAFSALIRDATNCLELLTRTLGDPDSEALKESEMHPKREIFRSKNYCGPEGERKIFFGRSIGMEPVVPSIGEKMMRDRDLAYNVLHKIACELQQYGTYDSLICEVNAIAESKETGCNLKANLKVWTEMVERMRDTYKTLENEFEAKKKECLEEIEKLDTDIDQSFCANNEKLDYVSRWEASKLEQQNTRHSLEEESILEEIESLERERVNDAKVSEEVRAFCNATIKHCEAEILAWTNRFNDEMERRQQESTELQEKIEKTIEFMEKSRELQAERHVLVGAYLDEQKRIEDEIKYTAAVNRAATLIQAIWKGYMVRHRLGPYADWANIVRKKSKKSKKKGKKGKK